MKIAFFTECYTPVINGVVTSIMTLRAGLIAAGHEVHIVAPGPPQPDDDPLIHRVPALPFPRHPYRFARPFPRLQPEFDELGIELIHCHHPFTMGRLGAEAAYRLDLPLVYTAHSLYDNMVQYSRSKVMRTVGRKAARGVVRRFCARADYVIVPSYNTRTALQEDGVVGPFMVVPSGIPGTPPSRAGRLRVRAQLGVEPDVPLLLYVGRIGPEKRVDLLLRAVAALKERDLSEPASKFLVALVGDGQCLQDMEELAEELSIADRLIFTGAQPHTVIGDWYSAADLFVMPSPAETQGIVLLEAMSAGLACVAVAEGGPTEVVVPNRTGLLTPFDPEEFADAIETLLLEPATRTQMGRAGRCLAGSYSPEAMADGVLDVYRQALLMGRRARGRWRTGSHFSLHRSG
jgi:glycosyltransferase involved in cell wall biosynthesis